MAKKTRRNRRRVRKHNRRSHKTLRIGGNINIQLMHTNWKDKFNRIREQTQTNNINTFNYTIDNTKASVFIDSFDFKKDIKSKGDLFHWKGKHYYNISINPNTTNFFEIISHIISSIFKQVDETITRNLFLKFGHDGIINILDISYIYDHITKDEQDLNNYNIFLDSISFENKAMTF